MLVQHTYKTLPFDLLRYPSSWNVHPFLEDTVPDTLMKSIRKAGILRPPLVIRAGEHYDVICGRKRIQCAHSLGLSDFLCCILSENSTKKSILRFVLEDQKDCGGLSLIETAHFAKICIDHLDEPDVKEIFAEEVAPKVNLEALLHLLNFDYKIQGKLHTGELNEKTAFDLLHLHQEDRSVFINLVELLQLGGNKQKRLLSLCRDLSCREGISIGSLIGQSVIRAVLEHKEMNIPQKADRLFFLLQRQSSPYSTAANEHFHAQVQALHLPPCCAIIPSNFFERDEVTLTVRFSNFEKCSDFCTAMDDLLHKAQ